jgi:hypothetical protein
MDLNEFIRWFKFYCNFDIESDPIFKKTLEASYEELSRCTIDGYSFFQIYQGEALCFQILEKWLRHLKLIAKQIPLPGSRLSLNIHGIPLNVYSESRDELLLEIDRLTYQCLGE